MEMERGRVEECKGDKTSNSSELEATDTANTVDCRGRPFNPHKINGGMRAAAFVLGLQAFEIMAIAAVGNNLITYVINEMHFSLSKSANVVTNFIGTLFLLSLLGGYLSDSYLGCFWTILIFGFLELSGFILLSVQAHLPQLKPPPCTATITATGHRQHCEEATGLKAFIFFLALYLVALGSGCVKPNMIAHGADQFSKPDNKLSTYFNGAYFAFTVGELVALTLLVWVQTHSGMDIGFGISAAAMAVGLICLAGGTHLYRNKAPRGSIFTPILQVFVAAFLKRKEECPSNPQMLYGYQDMIPEGNTVIFNSSGNLHHTERFRFLDKASIKTQDPKGENPWTLCPMGQVEQVKTLISVIPIFSSTIVFNAILAQLQTFSVQQGSSMDTRLAGNFHIPPASLQSIPYFILLFLVPLYDSVFVPFARKFTGHPSGITPLQRIGSGLFFATFSMVSAALMENKRRNEATNSPKTLSVFWITPQFLIFGVSEMLTAVGLIEFFYKQSLALKEFMHMNSFLTAITYCSYSFGFYLSSVLVSLVNKITSGNNNGGGWLSDDDLNKDRLDLFYWLLAVLSFLNFLNFLFWAKWYSKPSSPSASTKHFEDGVDNIP